jgi:hypothetical protein
MAAATPLTADEMKAKFGEITKMGIPEQTK